MHRDWIEQEAKDYNHDVTDTSQTTKDHHNVKAHPLMEDNFIFLPEDAFEEDTSFSRSVFSMKHFSDIEEAS
jgi:hypothetical protein